ncbi:hypothetical protein BC332_01977 [Capsicum chinense]|nr:hypothetical protein BC332_01977 [Capsicum chinense]
MCELSLGAQLRWLIPLGSGRMRELVARAPLIIKTLQAICSLGDASFEKNLFGFFPLLSSLISCEHGSNEIQTAHLWVLFCFDYVDLRYEKWLGFLNLTKVRSHRLRKDKEYASLPISHEVYDQYRDVSEEPNNNEDDEDYYVDNAPPYC